MAPGTVPMGNKIRAAAMVGPAATAPDLARGKAGTTPCRRVVDRSKADRAADPAQSRLAPAGVLSKADRVVNPNRADRVVNPNRADRVAVGVMGLVAGTSLAVAMGRAVVLRDLGALDHKIQGTSQGQAAFRLLVVPATILTPAVTEVEG